MTDAQTGVVSTMGLRNNDANKLKLQPHYMLGHSQISVWIRYSETTMKQGCMYIVQCTRMCIYVCALQALSDLHFEKKLLQNSPLRCVYKPDRKDSFLAIPVRVPDTTSSSKMKGFPHSRGLENHHPKWEKLPQKPHLATGSFGSGLSHWSVHPYYFGIF